MTDIYYSCDSHVVEGPEVFDGLVDRFGDRAPRVVNKWKDRDAVFVAWPSIDFAMSVGRLGIAGANLNLPETKEKIARGWDLINPGVKDPVARLKEQDQDGIVGEVMYPSINMLTFMVDDVEVVDAVFQRHNNWIRDYCSHAPERLIGVGCLSLRDIDMAIAELKRCAQMGIKGVAIPCTAPVDKPYSDPYYEPFWEAAEDIGLPLTMHIFCGSEPGMSLPKDWDQVVSYTLAHAAAWNTVSNLVTSGVCERHPKLHFVMAEWETGWIGHVLQRWDHAYYRARAVDQTPELPMLPTEYFPPPVHRHLRGRRDRRADPQRDRHRESGLGQRLPAPRRNLAQLPAHPRARSCKASPKPTRKQWSGATSKSSTTSTAPPCRCRAKDLTGFTETVNNVNRT